MPEDVEGKYWTCPEAWYAYFVAESDDPSVWKALEKAIKRAKVGLRMELLHNVGYPWNEDSAAPQRKRALALLASFLDDATVRDRSSDSEKFEGPCAGFTFERVSVQDYVAMEMARYLDVQAKFNAKLTQEEWTKAREKVREAWKREKTREEGKSK
jgi:hypothetical protein